MPPTSHPLVLRFTVCFLFDIFVSDNYHGQIYNLAAGHLGWLADLPQILYGAVGVLGRVLLMPVQDGARLAGGRTAAVEAGNGLYTRVLVWSGEDSSACASGLVCPGSGHSDLVLGWEMVKVYMPGRRLASPLPSFPPKDVAVHGGLTDSNLGQHVQLPPKRWTNTWNSWASIHKTVNYKIAYWDRK